MNNRSILIVSPSFKIGGIQRELVSLANEFVNSEIDVTFLSLLDTERNFSLDDRVNVIIPSLKRGKSVFNKVFYRLYLPFYIRVNVKKIKPQVVYSSADTFNPIVILATLGLNVRVIVKDITKPDRNFSLITKIGKKLLYPMADGFIAQTKRAANFYSQKFNNKLNIKIIGSMVERVENISLDKKEKIILQVGRISFEKGHDRIIDIFNRIENKDGWKLYITSYGPMFEQVKHKVRNLGLEEFVNFTGFVDDLSTLYSRASIFVMPSRMEGFPNALIEAMSYASAPVVFNTFPADEIIEDGVTGYILEDGDYKGFANRLEILMHDSSKRQIMGEKARLVNLRFSLAELSKETENFLFKV